MKMSMSLDGFVGTETGEFDWVFKSSDPQSKAWTLNLVQKAGLHIMNLAGELNLFSFWRRQNYCLISREMPYPGTDMMTLFSDFLFSIHEEVCINNDLHVVRYDSTFLRVRRVQTSPHFKEALRQPIFASADRVRNRELWGVVETSECTWWLIMR